MLLSAAGVPMKQMISVCVMLACAPAFADTALPEYRPESICNAVSRMNLGSTDSCLLEEQAALTVLKTEWKNWPDRRRALCVEDGAIAMMGASYVNLLWCLRNQHQ